MQTPHKFEVEASVRNGFPVVVKGEVYPADRDVGITSSYFGDFYVVGIKGQSVDFLRLKQSEIDELEEQVWSKLGY